MNNEVSVGDGFGGLVIITEVNPFTSLDAEDEQDGTNAETVHINDDMHLPVVVEVSFECEGDASLSSSDEGFPGFREEDVEESRVYAKLFSSISRTTLIENQSHFKMNGEICPEDAHSTPQKCRKRDGNGGKNTKRCGKDDEIPGRAIKHKRSTESTEQGRIASGGTIKTSSKFIGNTESYGTTGTSKNVEKSDETLQSANKSGMGPGKSYQYQSPLCAGANGGVPKNSPVSKNPTKRSGTRQTTLKGSGESGKDAKPTGDAGGSGKSSGMSSGTHKSTLKSDGTSRRSGKFYGDSELSCRNGRTIESSVCHRTFRSSSRNAENHKRTNNCGNNGRLAPGIVTKIGTRGKNSVPCNNTENGQIRSKVCLLKVENPDELNDSSAEPGFSVRDAESDTGSVCGSPEKTGDCLKTENSTDNGGEATQDVADDTSARTDIRSSSRIRRIPAKFREDVLSDGGWLKTQSRADSDTKKQNKSGSNQLKVSRVFSLTDDSVHSTVLQPGNHKKRSERDSQSPSVPEVALDSSEEDSTMFLLRPGMRRNVATMRNNVLMSVMAEHRSPSRLLVENGSSATSAVQGFPRFKAWSCKLCSYQTSSKQYIINHIRAHTKANFQCQGCSYTASSRSNLKVHMRKHTGEKPYKCSSCKYSCSTTCSLNTHLKKHSGDKRFACPECDHKSLTKSHLQVHIRTHTGVKPFSCCHCSYKTASAGHLKRHVLTHTGEKPFRCALCNYATSRKSALKVHMKTHETGKHYQCTECEFSADFPVILKRHMFEHAVDEHSYMCSHCDFITAVPATLRDHVLTHAGQNPKPFRCLQCGYTHMELHHMRTHMRTHTVKTFNCDQCSYSTGVSHNFKRHLTIHLGKWPYRCDACPKKYRIEDLLIRHKKGCSGTGQRIIPEKESREITGKRPYRCDSCPKKYRVKDLLIRHKKGCSGTGQRIIPAKEVDDKQKRFKCSKCDFTAKYFTLLKAHRRTHSENAPYQCSECGYACNSKSHITMHMRTHNGETPYKCLECDFGTTNTISLKRHCLSHTGLWSFSCDECDQRFRQKVHLDYHKKKGCYWAALPVKPKKLEELWPFLCDECDQRFRQEVHLDYHKKRGCYWAALPAKPKKLEVSDVSPKKIFRKALVKKIVGPKGKEKKIFEMDSEDDFNNWTSTKPLDRLNGFDSSDLKSRANPHDRTTRTTTSSLPLKKQNNDELYY